MNYNFYHHSFHHLPRGVHVEAKGKTRKIENECDGFSKIRINTKKNNWDYFWVNMNRGYFSD